MMDTSLPGHQDAPAMDTPESAPAVSFSGVHKSFGTVQAIAGLDLEIPRGQTLALLGRNGAGKSTSISLLLGLDEPDRGEVRLFAGAPRDAVRAGLVGAMLQDGSPIPRVTVDEWLRFVASAYPRPMPVAEALALAGIGELAGRRVDKLSGGQAQRLRFALAVIGRPALIVLDEPTAALDVEARRGFWRSIRGYASRGNTVVFSTHHLEEADEYADRVLVIDHGRTVADGTGEQIKRSVGGTVVSFDLAGRGSAGLRALPGVLSLEVRGDRALLRSTDSDATVLALAEQGRVRRLEVTAASLEEAFLSLTEQPTGDQPAAPPPDPVVSTPPSPPRVRTGEHGAVVPGGDPQDAPAKPLPAKPEPASAAPGPSFPRPASYLRPLLAYVRLEVRRTLRDGGYAVMGVVMPVAMYLLFTNLGVGDDTGYKGDYARYGMIGMAAYGALGAALAVGSGVAEDRGRGWLRQLRVTPLHPVQAVAGRALTAGVTVLPAIAAVLAAGALVNGVRLALWQWLAAGLLLWLGTIPFTLLGLGNGYALTGQATGVVSMACMMGLSVIGGLWVPAAAFPHWLRALSRWTPAARFGDLGWSVLDHHGPGLGTVTVLVGWLLVFAGYALLAYRRGARTA